MYIVLSLFCCNKKGKDVKPCFGLFCKSSAKRVTPLRMCSISIIILICTTFFISTSTTDSLVRIKNTASFLTFLMICVLYIGPAVVAFSLHYTCESGHGYHYFIKEVGIFTMHSYQEEQHV